MENRRVVPEYFDVNQPLTNVEGLPFKERMEQFERDLAQNRWYMEWKVRSDRELKLTAKAAVEEWLEWENYDKHGILPTAYPELVNGYPPRTMEYDQRKNRAICASNFTTGYKFVHGVKGLITSEKPPLGIVSDKCFDSTWVAVHGIDSICVVTRRQIMDMTRLAPFYQDFSTTQIMCGYAEAIISLVECLPYDDSVYNDDDLRPPYAHMIEAPFSAVSVGLDNIKVNEGSGNEDISYDCDLNNALLFLDEKMKSSLAFTDDETIQAAIIAFQHLCHWDLKAEDIWVTHMNFLDNCSSHLILDQIKDHFAIIDGSSCAVDSPEPFFFGTIAMENRNRCVVPEYFNVNQPLTNVEGLPFKEQMEQLERDLSQNRWYMEWRVRRDRELKLTAKAAVEEWLEWENYDKHGILPTLYPEVVNGYPPRTMEYDQRKNRAICASNFTTGYKFIQGVKGLITSENSHAFLSDKCFDSTWVAVHGMDSICVVTRRQIMDMTRLAPFYHEFSTTQIMCGFAEAIISLVECLPYDDSDYNDDDLRLCFGHMIEKPFSVVSVVPDSEKVHEGSGHEDISYDKATMFLEEKMKSGLAFPVDDTIQTAITAFQHMCLWELKAEDIWVASMEFPDNCSRHLILDQIKEHFAVINGCSSSGVIGSSAAALPKSDLKCDYESDNQPSPDFLASQFSSLSIF